MGPATSHPSPSDDTPATVPAFEGLRNADVSQMDRTRSIDAARSAVMPGLTDPPPNPGSGSSPQRLPPGRHGLPRHLVMHSQRERLLRAVAEAVAQDGYAEMTLTSIVKRAGVSRRTFYEHFTDKDAAVLATYDAAVEQLVNVLVDALGEGGDWRDRIRGAADALLVFLAAEPAFTRMAFIEAPTGRPALRARHRATITAFRAAIDALRPPGEIAPPEITTQVLVGGIQRVILDTVMDDRIGELPSLRPAMMYLLVLPWFGEREARRELEELAVP